MATTRRKEEVFSFPHKSILVHSCLILVSFNLAACDSDANNSFSARQAKDYSGGASSGGYSAGTVYATPASGYGSTYGSSYAAGTSYPPPHYAVAPIVLVIGIHSVSRILWKELEKHLICSTSFTGPAWYKRSWCGMVR